MGTEFLSINNGLVSEKSMIIKTKMTTLNVGDIYSHTSHKKFTLTVIKREGHIIMAFHPDYGYEVFKVRLRKEKQWPNGSITPAGEYPPSSGEFGKSAVYYPPKLYHAAIKVFDIYVSKYKSSNNDKELCSFTKRVD